MNSGNSLSVNSNTTYIKKSESKDINKEKIKYKMINNHHKVFLKEKVFFNNISYKFFYMFNFNFMQSLNLKLE